jgi:glycosyltransferase involved in cell wall biosynthesis
MKKPILLGVEGEAKELFIDEGKCGFAFIPEDAKDLAEKVLMILNSPELIKEFGNNGRNYVQEKFNRNLIASNLYDRITSL